jgi:hypothetical protein
MKMRILSEVFEDSLKQHFESEWAEGAKLLRKFAESGKLPLGIVALQEAWSQVRGNRYE